ncbi:MAG: phosphatidate cytidylyltransferase [Thermoleophilaceae bacterium]|nr:phosphatidate cytidylyltransferase [Thermoleophilaceae bacterium]
MASRQERRVRRARRRSQRSDLGARIVAALPAIAFALFIVAEGGIVFVLALVAVGALALAELYRMTERARPVHLAGYLGLAGLLLAAHYGDQYQLLLALALCVPLTFLVAVRRRRREHVAYGVAVTLFGLLWVGVALAHAVLLRDLEHGGGLVLDVLIGTFVGDTAAYLGGRSWGRRPLAPTISPNKTLEGLVTGIVAGGLAFWLFAVGYQDWFKGTDALIMGFSVALVGPVGDLFESLIKRDLHVKDSGTVFGAHGGVLDRLDAVFFTAVTGYYVARAVGFGA